MIFGVVAILEAALAAHAPQCDPIWRQKHERSTGYLKNFPRKAAMVVTLRLVFTTTEDAHNSSVYTNRTKVLILLVLMLMSGENALACCKHWHKSKIVIFCTVSRRLEAKNGSYPFYTCVYIYACAVCVITTVKLMFVLVLMS